MKEVGQDNAFTTPVTGLAGDEVDDDRSTTANRDAVDPESSTQASAGSADEYLKILMEAVERFDKRIPQPPTSQKSSNGGDPDTSV